MIEVDGISKRFGAVQALHSTTLAVPPERTTVLIGPSGCGKSTLLRVMIGLIPTDTGAIRIAGERLTPANAPLVRRRLGYVIQDGGLFPHLTARQNVLLMARFLKRPHDQLEQRLRELSELTHFPPAALDRYPAQISGGQRQRVSLMRALMLDPDVLLMDEPLGALDPIIRASLQRELREIFRAVGKTVVLVTHDLAEAAFLGDHIVLLRGGRIVQQGALRELARQPATDFVTEFIQAQEAPLAALAAIHEADG